jgi:predicted DNA-binding protein (MmcQ/YjbR family)
VTRDELIASALALPGAQEDYPFGDDLLTVKVGGKVFAWIPLADSGWIGTGVRVAVKAPTDAVTELRSAFPADVTEARPLHVRHWVAIKLGGAVSDDEVVELVERSHTEVVARLPRRLRPPSEQ